MNTGTSHVPKSAKSRVARVLLWFGVVALACVFALGLTAYRVFSLPRELTILKAALLSDMAEPLETTVQFSATPVVLSTARFVSTFLPDIPADARVALSGVKKASVGVYQCGGFGDDLPFASRWGGADASLAARGWRRTVAVSGRKEEVRVYLAEKATQRGDLRVCVAVRSGAQLVLVTADVTPDALIPLLEKHRGSSDTIARL